jgi:hypothetical protein
VKHRAARRAKIVPLLLQATDDSVDIRDELSAQSKDVRRASRAIGVGRLIGDLHGSACVRWFDIFRGGNTRSEKNDEQGNAAAQHVVTSGSTDNVSMLLAV